jgi:uncharacterized damage-inducible protein DinB
MSEQILTRWIERWWSFDFPTELYPCFVERLRGTPARAQQIASELSPAQLAQSFDGGWSIVRHMAHLSELERLFSARLTAYEKGEEVLPAADMTNAATVEREDEDAASVLAELDAVRAATVARLEQYPPEFFARTSWHERLGIDKRAVDTCAFFADHDDHHFALMRLLVRQCEEGTFSPCE